MTTLLQQAFDKVSKLSPDQQDLIARRILDELEDERKWTVSFAESQDMLESMALEAIAEHKAGKTRHMDEIL
jgi:hypothetical protein